MQIAAISYETYTYFLNCEMGRVSGKGKKQPSIAARKNNGSGEEEKLPVRRRGRPQKVLKDDIVEEDEVVKIEDDEEGEDTKTSELNTNNKNLAATENGRKRKRPSEVKENTDSVKEENGKTNSSDMIKSVGFRQIGSRRKNKPRRAAEVGVECR